MRAVNKLFYSLVLSTGVFAAPSYGIAIISEAETGVPEQESRWVEATNAPAPKTLLEIQQRVTQLEEELQVLRGQVEQQAHQIQTLTAASSPVTLPAPSVGSTVPAEPKVVTTPAAPVATKVEVPAKPAEVKPEGAEFSLYQKAYKALESREYVQAQALFKDLLQKFAEGEYSAQAWYWLGEIAFVEGQYPKAKEYFEKILQPQYANSPKVADALLKLGFVAQARGDLSEAQRLWQEVIRTHPGTTAARLAQSKLLSIQNKK